MGGGIMLGIQRMIVAELLAQSAYHRRCSYDAVSLGNGGIFRIDILHDKLGAGRLIVYFQNGAHE